MPDLKGSTPVAITFHYDLAVAAQLSFIQGLSLALLEKAVVDCQLLALPIPARSGISIRRSEKSIAADIQLKCSPEMQDRVQDLLDGDPDYDDRLVFLGITEVLPCQVNQRGVKRPAQSGDSGPPPKRVCSSGDIPGPQPVHTPPVSQSAPAPPLRTTSQPAPQPSLQPVPQPNAQPPSQCLNRNPPPPPPPRARPLTDKEMKGRYAEARATLNATPNASTYETMAAGGSRGLYHSKRGKEKENHGLGGGGGVETHAATTLDSQRVLRVQGATFAVPQTNNVAPAVANGPAPGPSVRASDSPTVVPRRAQAAIPPAPPPAPCSVVTPAVAQPRVAPPVSSPSSAQPQTPAVPFSPAPHQTRDTQPSPPTASTSTSGSPTVDPRRARAAIPPASPPVVVAPAVAQLRVVQSIQSPSSSKPPSVHAPRSGAEPRTSEQQQHASSTPPDATKTSPPGMPSSTRVIRTPVCPSEPCAASTSTLAIPQNPGSGATPITGRPSPSKSTSTTLPSPSRLVHPLPPRPAHPLHPPAKSPAPRTASGVKRVGAASRRASGPGYSNPARRPSPNPRNQADVVQHQPSKANIPVGVRNDSDARPPDTPPGLSSTASSTVTPGARNGKARADTGQHKPANTGGRPTMQSAVLEPVPPKVLNAVPAISTPSTTSPSTLPPPNSPSSNKTAEGEARGVPAIPGEPTRSVSSGEPSTSIVAAPTGIAQTAATSSCILSSPNASPANNSIRPPIENSASSSSQQAATTSSRNTLGLTIKAVPVGPAASTATTCSETQSPAQPRLFMEESSSSRSPLFTPDPDSPLTPLSLLSPLSDGGSSQDMREGTTLEPRPPCKVPFPPEDTNRASRSISPGAVHDASEPTPSTAVSDLSGTPPAQKGKGEKRSRSEDHDGAVSEDSPSPQKRRRVESESLGLHEDEEIVVKPDPDADSNTSTVRQLRKMVITAETQLSEVHRDNQRLAGEAAREKKHRMDLTALTEMSLRTLREAFISGEMAESNDATEKIDSLITLLLNMGADDGPAFGTDSENQHQLQIQDSSELQLNQLKERCKAAEELNAQGSSERLDLEKRLKTERAAFKLQRQADHNALEERTQLLESKIKEIEAKLSSTQIRELINLTTMHAKMAAERISSTQLYNELETRNRTLRGGFTACARGRVVLASELEEERRVRRGLEVEVGTERSLRQGLEREVGTERSQRETAERLLEDVKRECKEPFVVPALLDMFVRLQQDKETKEG